ncbi:AP-4 complex accessory subunit tepsin [Echinops telfairi]|uniref:AP-4 complex accessory subunit tepsin n=1 Tax=Echinops telfairi TaxID=9371 RepID=A0ABM0IWE8_ECHTE|nr:AP-4 complex accessory subunit tepsin [Echinops telfairi]
MGAAILGPSSSGAGGLGSTRFRPDLPCAFSLAGFDLHLRVCFCSGTFDWLTLKLFTEATLGFRPFCRAIGQRSQLRVVIGQTSAWRKRFNPKVTGIMAALPPLRDRLSFLHRLPVLLKGTADDDVPCPGYLFEEIANISHESVGSSQCLLEYLLRRLQSSSGRVKLKVLKILLYLCNHGSSSFLLILRRNSAFIQEATVFAGPPDPLHGSSLYQKVRLAAQDLGSALFSDSVPTLPAPRTPRPLPLAGMGSQPQPHSGALQGFGFSQERGQGGSVGEALLSTIQKAAEVVANAVLPGREWPGPLRPEPGVSTYQPAVTPPASHSQPPPGRLAPEAGLGIRAVRHQPGQPGGGWEECDSSPSSQGSSQNGGRSRVSDSGSGCVSESHSGTIRELGEQLDRVEALSLSDCQQEVSLVRALVRGPRAFLSREEVQRFLKECGRLNCEAVLELLTRHLDGTPEYEQMRTLCALSALCSSDLLSQERVLLLARPRLQELAVHNPGPVASKATKILRHLEASCQQRPLPWKLPAEPRPAVPQGPPPRPPDLLSDAVPPPGGQPALQPESTAPAVGQQPTPAPTLAPQEADTGAADFPVLGAGSDTLVRGLEADPAPRGCPQTPAAGGSGSLFAGMELVACSHPVRGRVPAKEPLLPHSVPEAPRTLSPRAAASATPAWEVSAFSFLNS